MGKLAYQASCLARELLLSCARYLILCHEQEERVLDDLKDLDQKLEVCSSSNAHNLCGGYASNG